MCVYTTAPPGCGHQMGQETKIPHLERRRIAAIIRHRRAEQEKLEDMASVILAPVTAAGWQVAAAVNEYDRREHEALRAWLAEYGPVLWRKQA